MGIIQWFTRQVFGDEVPAKGNNKKNQHQWIGHDADLE